MTKSLSCLFLFRYLAIISILVITNTPVPQSIFIICDSNNHHNNQPQQHSANKPPSSSNAQTNNNNNNNNKNQLNPKSEHPFNRNDIYLQISEPVNLSYTFKAKSSRIGVPFTETLTNIALVLAEPRDSCKTIINRLEIKDNIALVERGGCSFVEKCIEIERSGGIGMIVYDNDKHNDEHYVEMIDDTTSRNCSIPAVSLLGKDGHMIVQSLLALRLSRAVITIPVNTAINKESHTNPPWLMW